MLRREFLGWIGVGWLASSLPVAIALFTLPTRAEAPRQSIKVGSLADLKTQGFLIVKKPTKIIVIPNPNPKDKIKFLARTAECNHERCTVKWQANNQQFVCPCHGSAFKLDGSIAKGPATEALKSLDLRVEGQDIFVKV